MENNINNSKHVDFGEKIGNAKKDRYFSKKNGFADEFFEDIYENLNFLNSLEQEEYVNKSNVFKPFKAQEIMDSGLMEPSVLKYAQSIRDAISMKPDIKEKFRENAKNFLSVYVHFVKYTELVIQEGIKRHSTFDDIRNFIDTQMRTYLFKPYAEGETVLRYTNNGLMLRGVDAFSEDRFLTLLYNTNRDKIDYKNTTWEMLLPKARSGNADKKEESIGSRLDKLHHLSHVRRTGLVRRIDDEDISTEIMHSTFSFRGGEFGNWLGQKERGEVLNMAYEAFMDLADVIGSNQKDISLNQSLSIAFGSRGSGKFSAHYESLRRVINLTRMSGAGSLAHEWFHALDNWVGSFVFSAKNGEVSYENIPTLEHATIPNSPMTDELLPHSGRTDDVNRLIKVREQFLRLGMRLQYKETDLNALSRNLSRIEEAKRSLKSTKSTYKKARYNSIISEIENELGKTTFYKHAQILDMERGKPYFSTVEELGARAFESYVLDELKSAGYRNDYLVSNHKDEIELLVRDSKSELVYVSPYPIGEERVDFKNEFRAIFDILFPNGERMSFRKDMTQEFLDKDDTSKAVEEKNEKAELERRAVAYRQLSLF